MTLFRLLAARAQGETSKRARSALNLGFVSGLGLAVVLACSLPARADKKSDARAQFERAVQLRTQLEGYLEKDRALADYKKTVAAYHKVYLISVQADEVTPALIAEGELDQEMGRLFDPKYFQSAIDAYDFLLKQYPGSRYRGEALFSIAQIQKDALNRPDLAETSYADYLKRFPHSERAKDARAALKELAGAPSDTAQKDAHAGANNASGGANAPAASAAAAPAPATPVAASSPPNRPPDITGEHIDPRLADKGASNVKGVQAWSAADATRVIVALDDMIKYDAVRIASPDRIYFDLYKAHLSPKFVNKPIDSSSGLLKSLRVAQNKHDVVRLVLDVDGAKNYSAFLVANPYRLVIDVHAATSVAVNAPSPNATPANKASAPLPAPATAAQQPAPVAAPVAAIVSPASAENAKPADVPAKLPHETPTLLPAQKSAASASPDDNTGKAVAKMNSLTPKTTSPKLSASLAPPPVPKPTHDGQQSLTRALGLKINRIVIDAGHGGHDTGTIGPHGLMEKDLCLDVALRLGKIIENKLPGAEVVYTRKDDTFIPLEERTAIANNAKADLFISIHANSSHDPDARGIETYYLNFANSEDAMEVAARENAASQQSLHDLQDLIKKIARNEKIEESKELAGDIQGTLTQRLQLVSRSERNRGVKKAPFVVLIGADMPSVLSEISFVSNPNDEKLLRKPDQRQRIADGIYRGIASYLDSMNSLSVNQHKLVSENSAAGERIDAVRPVSSTVASTVASSGNPK